MLRGFLQTYKLALNGEELRTLPLKIIAKLLLNIAIAK
jgi:hypothetical protein